jgi:23S rRNA (adenine2503-C2)-methyltransferase
MSDAAPENKTFLNLPMTEAEPSTGKKFALSGLNLEQITEFTKSLGLPNYRAKQIHTWIYAKGASSFDEMTDLSQEIRQKLSAVATVPCLEIAHLQVSKDGTRKYLFKLADGKMVESVLMSFSDRPNLTACVSSQVGCAVGCTFCATGYLGFTRNLTSQEIIDQVMSIQREAGVRIANIVYMGQGEPLLNVEEVIASLHTMIQSVGIGQRHITVSTSGIISGIKRLAKEELQITLALSLHAPDSETREQIVPISKKYTMGELIAALKEYARITKRRITIEYVLLAGITDSVEQARQLSELVRDVPCLINLIPYNPTQLLDGTIPFARPAIDTQKRFRHLAQASGKTVTIRLERGTDIDAACGQLHNAYQQAKQAN